MNLGGFLGNVFNGAKQAVGNIGNNLQHPMNIVNNVAHPVEQLYNNVFNRPSQATAPTAQSPTNLGNVYGTLVAQNVANQQKFTPMFRNIVQGANPVVTGGIFGGQLASNPGMSNGAGGDYLPNTNQIELKANQLDPYTVTHEGLHAAYNSKTPNAQQLFQQLLSQATPDQQSRVSNILASPIYAGARAAAAQGSPYSINTEQHSYLPLFNQANQAPALAAYYQHYFGNPVFGLGVQQQEQNGKYTIADKTGFNTEKPGYPLPRPQFSDWMNY